MGEARRPGPPLKKDAAGLGIWSINVGGGPGLFSFKETGQKITARSGDDPSIQADRRSVQGDTCTTAEQAAPSPTKATISRRFGHAGRDKI